MCVAPATCIPSSGDRETAALPAGGVCTAETDAPSWLRCFQAIAFAFLVFFPDDAVSPDDARRGATLACK